MSYKLPGNIYEMTLLQLLSNAIVLNQLAPYLHVSSILSIGAISRAFRHLIYSSPSTFRRLDLTEVKATQFDAHSIDNGGQTWRNVQLDENMTEDEFYAGPIRGVFSTLSRAHVLSTVRTLILDGLPAPSEILSEIILDPRFSVQLLSIREAQNLNERKLMQILEYAVRPSRSQNPRLQGLYIFGPKDCPLLSSNTDSPSSVSAAQSAATSSDGSALSSIDTLVGAQWNQKSQIALAEALNNADQCWHHKTGRIISCQPLSGWAATVDRCKGHISFDTVMCNGPRHKPRRYQLPNSEAWYVDTTDILPPALAIFALRACVSCKSAPEGLLGHPGGSLDDLPLLAPPPLHSSTSKAAKFPFEIRMPGTFIARCYDCIGGRYCETCYKWWCESCYDIPEHTPYPSPHVWEGTSATAMGDQGPNSLSDINNAKGVERDCWECGLSCAVCISKARRTCKVCGGGYCSVHNEGSTITTAGRHAIHGCRC